MAVLTKQHHPASHDRKAADFHLMAAHGVRVLLLFEFIKQGLEFVMLSVVVQDNHRGEILSGGCDGVEPRHVGVPFCCEHFRASRAIVVNSKGPKDKFHRAEILRTPVVTRSSRSLSLLPLRQVEQRYDWRFVGQTTSVGKKIASRSSDSTCSDVYLSSAVK